MIIFNVNNLKYRRAFLLLLMGILATVLINGGCVSKQVTAPTAEINRLKVAVTIVPQATFVKWVGGDFVDVVTMVPSGGNPENYSPTPQQMIQFSDTKLYFLIGVPAEEAQIIPKIESMQPSIKIVNLPELVEQKYVPVAFPSGERDPHMWMSPKRVQEMIRITALELSSLDPAHEAVYRANASAYIDQLAQLDQQISSALSGVESRTFIIYHPALGYYASDYGLTMVALEEEGKEATAIDLQKIIDLARNKGIKVVFYQAEIDSKQSRTLADEIGGQAKMISPLSADYINNLHQITDTFAKVLNQ